MSVQVTLRGRLGNNLFQYALGRIIAEHHGFELTCRQIPLAPSHPGHALRLTAPATLGELSGQFPNAPLLLPGRSIPGPVESYEVDLSDSWGGQVIDLPRILADDSLRQIRLHGYFQRFEYYAPYVGEIRQWFLVHSPASPQSPGPHDVLVNIRRGVDFGLFARVMPMGYYDQVLDGLADLGQVYVCGTDIDDVVRARLARYRPIYYQGSPLEHFVFFQKFNRIILSNSSFAWWAAFLSEADEVYAPRVVDCGAYRFSVLQDVDLCTRESRYHEIDLTSIAELEIYLVNRARGAQLFEVGSEVFVQHPGRSAALLEIGRPERLALGWFVVQERPVAVSELGRRFADIRLNALVPLLIDHRLASVLHRYREPDESSETGL